MNIEKVLKQLGGTGAFLTVKNGEKVNIMTVGWASFGYMWKRNTITIMVRKQNRYTFELIENTDEFTLSVPFDKKMDKELIICGTKSGRDINKIETCGFDMLNSGKISTPIIGGCDFYIEGKVMYKQEMDLSQLNVDLKNSFYSDNNTHVLYTAEIL